MKPSAPPAKSEATIQAEIRLALGRLPHVRLFRNNRGVAWMGKLISKERGVVVIENARPVDFGLTDGASDLIGLTQVTITASMVGRTLAVFTAAEVKRPGVKMPDHQRNFVEFVTGFGGIAREVHAGAEAVELVTNPQPAARDRSALGIPEPAIEYLIKERA